MSKRIYVNTLIAASAFAVVSAIGAQQTYPGGQLAQAGTLEPGAPAARAVVDDREITLRIQSALSKDKEIAQLSLAVKVTDGNVALTGFAPNRSQVDRALEIVRAVPGVKSVKSEVRVS